MICDRRNALKCFFALFLPIWLLGCALLWFFHYSEVNNVKRSLGVNIAHTLDLQKESVILDFVSIVSDLKLLSGIVELSGFCDDPQARVKEKLSEEFGIFLKSKGIYEQIVLIDGSGQEVLKVDYNNGTPKAITGEHLYDRSKQYYFQETFRIVHNEVYISPLDLKVEHGQIEEPFKPMIRLGTPLVNAKKTKTNVIMVSYLGQQLIDNLVKIASDQPGDFMFLNRNGYWMKGPRKDQEWGFMFADGHTRSFRESFPDEWRQISQQETGAMTTANGLFSFSTIYPFKGVQLSIDSGSTRALFANLLTEESYYWKLVGHVPPSVLSDFFRPAHRRFRLIFFILTGFLLISYMLLVFGQYYRERSARLELEKSKMDQILNYGEKIRTITNLNMLIDFIIEQASLILESERCSLMLLDEETGELCIRGAVGLNYDVIKESKLSLGQGIAGLVAEEGKPLLVKVIDEDKRIGRKNSPSYRSRSFLSVPVKLDNKLVGVVNVTEKKDRQNPTYTDLDLKVLLAIVRQAAVAIENAELSKELKYLTITDPLTNLYNYRHLMECLAYEIKRFKRFDRPLCLLIIDVDDFKEYNDAYGQEEGNVLLKKIAAVLTKSLREVDIICRYAGDEFVVILPDTQVDKTRVIAEKVRQTMEGLKFRKPMTVSMGIAKAIKGM
ncbi:MAG TPA: sensor domain-containing diguanylate cyclase, partial [Candidatus Omnitrophota bacterium]|nr:sensor domain-containing diguanylate cyclase [Candidatus Omnitrophota bacterium]